MRIGKTRRTDARRRNREIYFAHNSVRIRPGYRRLIGAHAKYLLQMPQMVAALVGHRDAAETTANPARLGRSRAAAVRDELAKQGVDRSRMTIASFGARMPVTASRGAGLRAANRRVDIIYFGSTEVGGSPPLSANKAAGHRPRPRRRIRAGQSPVR